MLALLLLVAALPLGAAQDTMNDAAFLTDTTAEAGLVHGRDCAAVATGAQAEAGT